VARWLLDSSALLVLLRSEAGVVRVHEVIAEADEILISSVSIAEVARRCKALGASSQEISLLIEQCRLLATRIIDITFSVAERSVNISSAASQRLPLVDALIAACAAQEQARLLHRDWHFSSVPATFLTQEHLPAN
jgi:predicted nucleic acid-binding protein